MTRPVAHVTSRMKWRAARKAFLNAMPWAGTRRYERQTRQLREREAQLADLLLAPHTSARAAQYSLQVPLTTPATDELCLFVTHAANQVLKPHVIHHIESLLDNGISVLLIANRDDIHQQMALPESLSQRLAGCMIRQNMGYDFAAWAHAYSLIDLPATVKRLYLINDSIAGPLSPAHFQSVLQRCRKSTGDLLGLTENQLPLRHLQSFFLAINSKLLHSPIFRTLMDNIVNLPTKHAVISLYETHLTRFVSSHGFCCDALFRSPFSPHACEDETILNWAGLIDRGFPYLKVSVIRETSELSTLHQRVPAEYLSAIR